MNIRCRIAAGDLDPDAFEKAMQEFIIAKGGVVTVDFDRGKPVGRIESAYSDGSSGLELDITLREDLMDAAGLSTKHFTGEYGGFSLGVDHSWVKPEGRIVEVTIRNLDPPASPAS